LVSRAQRDVFALATSVARLSALTFDVLVNRMGSATKPTMSNGTPPLALLLALMIWEATG